MLYSYIRERRIEDRHDKTEKETHEFEFDADNVQLNVDQYSCGNQPITDDSDNVIKRSQTVREILEKKQKV